MEQQGRAGGSDWAQLGALHLSGKRGKEGAGVNLNPRKKMGCESCLIFVAPFPAFLTGNILD